MPKFEDWTVYVPAPVIGVDEAGRGCLAGSVYAAAVVLNPEKPFEQFVDSKTLSQKKREDLFEQLSADHWVAVASSTVEEIEKLNILWASMLAMRRAVAQLCRDQEFKQGHILVDGNRIIPDVPPRYKQSAMVKGDGRFHPIAAASIAAKVSRDRDLIQMNEKFPEYGFAAHKGYATKEHKEAIAKYGPLPIHRAAFAGVKEHLGRSDTHSQPTV